MRPATRYALLLLATAALTSCSSDTDAGRVGRDDCAQLRDHLVDLRMESVTADHDQHRAALRSSLGASFISSCLELTTEPQLRCALQAADAQALAACAAP